MLFLPALSKVLGCLIHEDHPERVRIVELLDALDRERCWQTLNHFNQALAFLVRAFLFRDIMVIE